MMDSAVVRVLLVSRQIQTIEVLCQLMQHLAMHVEPCCDCAAAMRKLCRAKFEGVVVDLDTEKNAIELLRKLREMTSHRAAVAYAIVKDTGQKAEAFQAGANFVFEKPLSAALIDRTLKASYPLLIRERRRCFRCPIQTTTYVRTDSVAEFSATSLNLSESGIAIISPVPLRAGNRLHLRFQLPGRSNFLTITGEVSWSDASGRAGIQFLSPPPNVSEQLQTWLSTRLHDRLAAGDTGLPTTEPVTDGSEV